MLRGVERESYSKYSRSPDAMKADGKAGRGVLMCPPCEYNVYVKLRNNLLSTVVAT